MHYFDFNHCLKHFGWTGGVVDFSPSDYMKFDISFHPKFCISCCFLMENVNMAFCTTKNSFEIKEK